MENETKDDIITSENKDEKVEEVEETTEDTKEVEEKPKETPEAKKARLERQLKKVNKELGVEEKVAEKPKADKSDELNEGQLALLIAKGYDHAEDTSFIEAEMAESGKSLTEVLNMNYIKENLKDLKKARDVKDATPDGNKRSHTGVKSSADYWIAKGEMPPNTPENTKLRRDIVNARAKTDKEGKKFSNVPLIQ